MQRYQFIFIGIFYLILIHILILKLNCKNILQIGDGLSRIGYATESESNWSELSK